MRSFAVLSSLVGCAALVGGVLPSSGLSDPSAAASLASIERSAAVLAPGTIFVANASAGFEGGLGTGNGSVTAYRPDFASGDESPLLVLYQRDPGPHRVSSSTPQATFGLATTVTATMWSSTARLS